MNEEHPDISEAKKKGLIAASQGFPENLDPLKDKDGHGTHVASVLLKTAPNAALLIARVADNKRQIPQINDYSAVEKASTSKFITNVRPSNGRYTNPQILSLSPGDSDVLSPLSSEHLSRRTRPISSSLPLRRTKVQMIPLHSQLAYLL